MAHELPLLLFFDLPLGSFFSLFGKFGVESDLVDFELLKDILVKIITLDHIGRKCCLRLGGKAVFQVFAERTQC